MLGARTSRPHSARSALKLGATNFVQRKVLLIGSALLALMLLFPPWEYFDGDSCMRARDGYHFVLSPPPRENIKTVFAPYQPRFPAVVRIEVDRVRLLAQCLAIILACCGLAIALRTKRSVLKVVFSAGLFAISAIAFILGFSGVLKEDE